METATAPRPLGQPPLKQKYLLLYNFVSCLLWICVLGRVVLLVPLVGAEYIYGGVGEFVKWTQTLAVLEVVHSLLGIVRAPALTTLMQVSSRLLLVWAVVDQFPDETSSSWGYSSMLVAWSVTEVVRYGYFVVLLSGRSTGGVVGWLRYNTFYVLYPLGISSECYLIYLALGPARETYGPWAAYAFIAILIIYIPGSYILFTHMMAQRRRMVRGKGIERRPPGGRA